MLYLRGEIEGSTGREASTPYLDPLVSNLPKWAADRHVQEPAEEEPRKKALPTAEEVMHMISELAESGEGADRRWALGQLRAEKTSSGVPEPLEDQERVIRLARLMQGCGRTLSRRAFTAAFYAPNPGDRLFMTNDEPPPILPTNLDEFYERFPTERPASYPVGYPKGYPYRGKRPDKADWIEKRSIFLIRRERKAALEAEKSAKLGKDSPTEEATPC